MMSAENLPPKGSLDPVDIVSRHLRDGEDVVRCAAARALGTLGDSKAAPALVEALLDEDPDVRVDAMAALVDCARPEDADAIRRSLMGDPVKEVKVFAVRALGRLADGASVPLLCALAKTRCDHDVAWEDDAGMWDEWLDVQVAAIAALGDMGAGDAIETLLEARSDEMGQELDTVVFNALAKIHDGGVPVLAGLLRDRSAAVRAGAFRALSKARRDVLVPLSGLFATDASADIRCLAVGCLDAEDPLASRLALADPDAGVRRAALEAFASLRPEIAQAALGDTDEEVRAIALEALVSGPVPLVTDDLAANVLAWMENGGVRLSACCARLLPAICGAEAQDPLCGLAADTDRPLETRIAALAALGQGRASETAIEALKRAVVDPARQMRAAALTSLAAFSKAPEGPLQAAATDLLVKALRGDLVASDGEEQRNGAAPGEAAGAGDAEGPAPARIAIAPDGEIVSAEAPREPSAAAEGPDSNVVEGVFPRSTLDAIQAPGQASLEAADPARPEEEPEDLAAGHTKSRRRRVAVDGPDDFGEDLRLIALGVAADCPDSAVEQALLETLTCDQALLRAVAFKALAQRSESLPLAAKAEPLFVAALEDPDPAVRGQAARAVALGFTDAADRLAPLLDDPDAIVRATALEYLAASLPQRVFAGLRDGSLLVRRVALESVTRSGSATDLAKAITVCLEEGRVDSLTEACRQSGAAQDILLSVLKGDNLERRRAQSALEAIAAV